MSPTYAREIQTPGARRQARRRPPREGAGVVGIVNGVDYGVWNPATDSNLAARYDAEDPSNKARCKGALQKELGLALEPDAPLVV